MHRFDLGLSERGLWIKWARAATKCDPALILPGSSPLILI